MIPDKPFIKYFETAMLPCFIGIATDPKSHDREMDRLKIPKEDRSYVTEGSDATTQSFTQRKGGGLIIIVNAPRTMRKYGKIKVTTLIAHEAVHVFNIVAEKMNIKGKCDDEFQAYTIDWLTYSLTKEIYKE